MTMIALSIYMFFTMGLFNSIGEATVIGFQQSRQARTARTNLVIVALVNTDPANGTLTLKWSLKNTSDKDISVRVRNVFLDYRITVKDERNRAVPLTERGQQATIGSFFTSQRTTVLGAGNELTTQLQISDFYDMKARGVYTIVVERRVPSPDGKGSAPIRSNAVKVRVRK
jgi:hypothetical protein